MDLQWLTQLTQAFGPTGYESEIRELIRQEIAPYVDELRVDPLGNLIAHRKGTGPKLILNAHLDEIGVMVNHIDEEGFLRFAPVGVLSSLHCVGARVRFADGTIGAINVEARKDSNPTPALRELYIDIGAPSAPACSVKVGDPAVFVNPLIQQGNRIISKTLDDRIGCYILTEILRHLDACAYDLYCLFTVQEEVTHAGARAAAFGIGADLAIAVDVTPATDMPKASPTHIKLGNGPAIKVQDPGLIAHPQIRSMLQEAAEEAGIAYQMEVLGKGTTDASFIQLAREGVPSGCLSIPCRFVHTPSEMVDSRDVESAIRLLKTLLKSV